MENHSKETTSKGDYYLEKLKEEVTGLKIPRRI